MKSTAKIMLLAAGTAILSSAATAMAIGSFGRADNHSSLSSTESAEGRFYTVASTVTPATDFTTAAENTINGVVSIKS